MVAMDIPVEPTVPSNILEPVYGCNNPWSSASSITATAAKHVSHFSMLGRISGLLRNATRSLTLPPGFRNWNKFYTTSHFIRGGEKSYLGFAEYLHSKGVAQRVDPDQRCITFMNAYQVSVYIGTRYHAATCLLSRLPRKEFRHFEVQ